MINNNFFIFVIGKQQIMRRNNYLIGVLHRFFTIGFWLGCVLWMFSIASEIFTENGKLGTLHTGHYSRGFPVPVQVDISIPDSIVTYKVDGGVIRSSNYHKEDLSIHDEAPWTSKNLIPDTLCIEKELIKNEISIIDIKDKKQAFNINSSRISTSGYVNVKSPSLFLNTVLFAKKYLIFLLWLACFYQLKKIFLQLRKRFSFTIDLAKRVKWLGLLFIMKESVQLIIVIFLSQYYGLILVDTYQDNTLLQGINIMMNPRLDFDITIFVIGLSLVILSVLLTVGNNMEQENQLTI